MLPSFGRMLNAVMVGSGKLDGKDRSRKVPRSYYSSVIAIRFTPSWDVRMMLIAAAALPL